MNFYDGDKVNAVITEGIKVILSKELGRFFKGDYRDEEIICIDDRDWKTIKTVSFPESLEIIDAKAFECCDKIEELSFPKHLKEIRLSAFLNCVNLKKISIPVSVKVIQTWAFGNFDIQDIYYEGNILDFDRIKTGGAFKNIRHLHCTDCEVDFTRKPYYIEDFSYKGTIEEWKQTMGDHWLNDRVCRIHCSDGVIAR